MGKKPKLIWQDKAYGKDMFGVLGYTGGKVALFSHSKESLDRLAKRFIQSYIEAEKFRIKLIDICYGPYKREQYHKQRMMQALHRGDISYLEYNRLRMKSKSFIQKLREETI